MMSWQSTPMVAMLCGPQGDELVLPGGPDPGEAGQLEAAAGVVGSDFARVDEGDDAVGRLSPALLGDSDRLADQVGGSLGRLIAEEGADPRALPVVVLEALPGGDPDGVAGVGNEDQVLARRAELTRAGGLSVVVPLGEGQGARVALGRDGPHGLQLLCDLGDLEGVARGGAGDDPADAVGIAP